jgi:hypothetical protein
MFRLKTKCNAKLITTVTKKTNGKAADGLLFVSASQRLPVNDSGFVGHVSAMVFVLMGCISS